MWTTITKKCCWLYLFWGHFYFWSSVFFFTCPLLCLCLLFVTWFALLLLLLNIRTLLMHFYSLKIMLMSQQNVFLFYKIFFLTKSVSCYSQVSCCFELLSLDNCQYLLFNVFLLKSWVLAEINSFTHSSPSFKGSFILFSTVQWNMQGLPFVVRHKKIPFLKTYLFHRLSGHFETSSGFVLA